MGDLEAGKEDPEAEMKYQGAEEKTKGSREETEDRNAPENPVMTVDNSPIQLFEGVYLTPDPRNPNKKIIATENLMPGRAIYGETLMQQWFAGKKIELRSWDPFRSKLSAAVLNRLNHFPFSKGSRCLYLGASTGTTVSHISDIVGLNGKIFAVEVASRVARELMENVVKYRKNVVPIVSDAKHPEKYSVVHGDIEIVYCDVAQPDQTEIAVKNCVEFLRNQGYLFLVVKASSIDALKSKEEVFADQTRILKESNFDVMEEIDLEPFDRNHAMIVAKSRG
jgi:fibrillarin-like pre-rRNA processing protein